MTTTDTAPAPERTEFTHDEWVAEARARFGDDARDWAFQCPRCWDVATARDFPGPMRERVSQECIGRHRADLPELPADRGCDWAAYGFIPGPVAVTMPDGSVVRVFRFAPAPSQAPQSAADAPAATTGPASADDAPDAAIGAGIGNEAPSVDRPFDIDGDTYESDPGARCPVYPAPDHHPLPSAPYVTSDDAEAEA